MVQFLPASRYKQGQQSLSERFFDAFGQSAQRGIQEAQEKQNLQKAFQGLEPILSDPNLNEQQKLIATYKAFPSRPELAKAIGDQLSRSVETPLQQAQRRKIQHDIDQAEEENTYFKRLIGVDNRQDEETEEPYGETSLAGEPESETPQRTTKKALTAKFDFNDPSTWSKKQINNFRSYQGSNVKGKTLAKMAQNEFERRGEESKKEKTYKEKVAPYKSALNTIAEMRNIGKKGNLGIGTSLSPLPGTQRDAAEYERLGKSLISLASTITIRNQREFDVLAHDLYDPTLTDAKREGILSAMEKIIRSSMEGVESPDEEFDSRVQQRAPAGFGAAQGGAAPKEKPPLQSFYK